MNQLETNKQRAIENAKGLSERATLAEQILKEALLEFNIPFEFQKPLYSNHTCYIADFYILGRKLVVELDGSSHDGNKEKDDLRTAKIKKHHGFEVMRFKNTAIFADVIKVVNKIYNYTPKKETAKVVKMKPNKPKKKKKGKQAWCTMYDPLEKKRARVMAKIANNT